MSYLQTGTPVDVSSVTATVTVPAGITAAHTGVFIIAASTGQATTFTPSNSRGVTTVTMFGSAIVGTLCWAAYKVTGLVTGDTFTVTSNPSRVQRLVHHYFDADLTPAASASNRASSVTTTTLAAVSTTAGQKVYGFLLEKSSTTGTALTGVSNSEGRTVTTDHFSETTGSSTVSNGLIEFVDTDGSTSGTTTATYNIASANGTGFHATEAAPAPVTSGQIGSTWASDTLPTAIRGAALSSVPGASVRMIASTSSDLSSPTYSAAVTVPSSGWITAKISGLSSSTPYFLGWEVAGTTQTDGRFQARTLPTPSAAVASFSALTSSCQSNNADHPIFDLMAAESADYFVHLGDLNYADPTTLAQWRTGFSTALNLSKMKALVAAMPMRWLWDNHDGPDVDSTGTKVTGVFDGLREIDGDFPDATLGYKTWVHGRVRFIRTDMWGARSAMSDAESTSKTMLGATQKQWWKDTLSAATEPIIVWLPGWPTTRVAGGRWNSYSTETTELQTWLNERPGIKARMLIVGGDSHNVLGYDGVAPASGLWFSGIPSLNASPISQLGNSTGMSTTDYNIVRDNSVNGAGDGFYARHTFADDGTTVTYTWTVKKYDGTTAATWSRAFTNAVTLPAEGVVAGASGTSAAPTVIRQATGTVDATSATSANATRTIAVTGSVAATSTTSAAPNAVILAAGTVAATSQTFASPTVAGAGPATYPATGTVAATSGTVAAPVVIRMVAGVIEVTSATTAAPSGVYQAAGVVAASSGAVATPSAIKQATGAVAATSATSAAPVVLGPDIGPEVPDAVFVVPRRDVFVAHR